MQVTSLATKDELESYFKKLRRTPPGRLIAVVFSTPSYQVADKDDPLRAQRREAVTGGRDTNDAEDLYWQMDYEVRRSAAGTFALVLVVTLSRRKRTANIGVSLWFTRSHI